MCVSIRWCVIWNYFDTDREMNWAKERLILGLAWAKLCIIFFPLSLDTFWKWNIIAKHFIDSESFLRAIQLIRSIWMNNVSSFNKTAHNHIITIEIFRWTNSSFISYQYFSLSRSLFLSLSCSLPPSRSVNNESFRSYKIKFQINAK